MLRTLCSPTVHTLHPYGIVLSFLKPATYVYPEVHRTSFLHKAVTH